MKPTLATATETFCLTLHGYWRNTSLETYPSYPGVFFVFEAKKNYGRVIPLKLLYVGEAEDVGKEISGLLEENNMLKHYIREANTVCFITAQVPEQRERVQAAYVYAHKPPANRRYKYVFPFHPTRIASQGVLTFMKDDFTV